MKARLKRVVLERIRYIDDPDLDGRFIGIRRSNRRTVEQLIVHQGYHKVMTSYFNKIFRHFCKKYSLSFIKINSVEEFGWIDKDRYDFILINNQSVDFDFPCIRSHLFRDPRDLVVSGYLYHLWSDERWLSEKDDRYDGLSYQQYLNGLSKEDGINAEIEWRSHSNHFENMLKNFHDEEALQIRYEDFFGNEKAVIHDLFRGYGFDEEKAAYIADFADASSFNNKKKNTGVRSHARKGTPGDWRNHFSDRNKDFFKERFPGLIRDLDYERDENW